jgi:hypothetical protein
VYEVSWDCFENVCEWYTMFLRILENMCMRCHGIVLRMCVRVVYHVFENMCMKCNVCEWYTMFLRILENMCMRCHGIVLRMCVRGCG